MRTELACACAALLAVSCLGAGDGPQSPRPASMEPATGIAASSVRVVIRGEGFLARPSEQQAGGGAELDTRHRAWLDGVELVEVTWVDTRTLEATVPAGLSAGSKRLEVENAFGRRGALDAAFVVSTSPMAMLEGTLVAAPATFNVGQAATVTFTVRNGGSAAAREVVPEALALSGAAATGASVVGPSPVSAARLEPGATATFTWSVTAAAPGALSLVARARAADDLTSIEVSSPAVEASATVQPPAQLTAVVAASLATANVGQAVPVTLTLANGGAARADITAVTPGAVGPAASCGAVTPALPQSVDTGATLELTWTCTASAAGALSLGAAVLGVDGTSGAELSAAPAAPAMVTVQTPAVLSATIAVSGNPTVVPVGAPLAVVVTVMDAGQAGASVTRVDPVVTPAAAATCGAPSPSPPQAIAGLATRTFGFSCTALVAGGFTLGATVAGTDANTGEALQTAPAGVVLQAEIPAVLTATVAASRSTANVGQAVTVTFTLINGGTALANITAIAPALSGTAPATCGAATPATGSIQGGKSGAFTWTCTASAPGTLALTATATGTDGASGAPLSVTPAAPASVTVQTPAALAASSFEATAPVTVTGQPVEVTLVLANSGEGAADLVAIVPSVTPSGGTSCTPAAPAPPQRIAGGTSLELSWSCTATAAGSYTLGAVVSAADVNTSQMIAAAIAPLALAVQAPAALTVGAFTAARSTASTGQAVSVSLTVANAGGSAATVTAVSPSIAPATSPGCTVAAPATPQGLPSGGSATFTWTCTASSARSYTLGAAISATDAVTGAPLSASASPIALTVQDPASLSASIAVAGGNPLVVGQPASVTLTVTNGGGAAANLTAVAASATGNTGATCATPSPEPPRTVAGGSSEVFTWTCTPSAAGSLVLGASVSGTDANTGASLEGTAPGVTRTVVSGAGLAVTTFTAGRSIANTGQAVTLTLVVTNGGGTEAIVNAVTPSITPAATPGCTVAAPATPRSVPAGDSRTFTWTCTSSVAGSYTLGAAVSAEDAVTSAPLSAEAIPLVLTVQSPASLIASIAADGPDPLILDETVNVTLTVTNLGGAPANLTDVRPSASGDTATSCGTPSPALPQALGGGASAVFTWACTPTRVGSLVLDATVEGRDANTNAALEAGADPAVARTVVSGTTLAVASFTADRSVLNTGEPAVVSLTVSNGGQNAGTVTSVTRDMVPSGPSSCTPVSPAPPRAVPAGGSVTFGWTCTASVAGSYTLVVTIGATDAGGDPVPLAAAPIPVTVQTPAALAPAAVEASRATADVGQAVEVTLVLLNGGEAAASVSSVTPSATGSGAAGCFDLSPPGSFSIAGGASVTLRWTCTGSVAGAVTLSATVSAADANSGGDASPVVTGVGVVIQTPAALVATLTPSEPSVVAGTPVGVALALQNTGQATAQVTAVAPAIGPSGSCVPAAPASQDVGGGGSFTFNWTCTATGEGSHDLGATVTATDANTGATLSVTVPTAAFTVTAPPPAPGSEPAFAEVVLLAVDPLGDGTAQPLLGETGGAVWVGPGQDGRTVAWLDPAGARAPVLGALQTVADASPDAVADVAASLAVAASSSAGKAPSADATAAGVTTLFGIEGIVYAADAGGIARSETAPDGITAWVDATPVDPAWWARASVAVEPATASARWPARDRAVPALVAFGGCGEGACLLAARNVVGVPGEEPPVAAQLWRCAPSGGRGACRAEDWSLAAPDPEGTLTRLGGPTSEALTVLATTPRWLYVGLDGPAGVRLFRAAAAPRAAADLLGRAGCAAGSPGCEGLGGDGLGDPRATRFLDAKVLTVGGATSLWIVAGDGVSPARVYRVED